MYKIIDPGYDYLFSKNIGWFNNLCGGANSHMAIRCAELGIPAVIGCGENAFVKYSQQKNLEIDAANKTTNNFIMKVIAVTQRLVLNQSYYEMREA